MSIIRTGIEKVGLRLLYEFYKLVLYESHTDPSIYSLASLKYR